MLLSRESKALPKQCFSDLSLTATISSVLSMSPQSIIEKRRNLTLFIVHFLDGDNNLQNFSHGLYVICNVICSWMNKQKIQFLPNTWLDIINNIFSFCTTICFDFDTSFLLNSGTCQMFKHKIAKYHETILVCWISSFSSYFVYSIWFLSFCGGRILKDERWNL